MIDEILLASRRYEEADYIRDYDEFLAAIAREGSARK